MDLKRWLRANWDRAAAWLCVVLGVVFLLLGWEGVSKAAYPAEQLPFILSGGIGGALMVAMGATLLISADLRDEWQKLDRIEKKLDQVTVTAVESNGKHVPSAEPSAAAPAAPASSASSASSALAADADTGRVPIAAEAPRRSRRRPLTAQRDDE
jgi:hypothetical protein